MENEAVFTIVVVANKLKQIVSECHAPGSEEKLLKIIELLSEVGSQETEFFNRMIDEELANE